MPGVAYVIRKLNEERIEHRKQVKDLETRNKELKHRLLIAFDIAQDAINNPLEPEGWQLVPIQPDHNMLDAGCESGTWKAMLENAPRYKGGRS